jgi:WD40 repeat protein
MTVTMTPVTHRDSPYFGLDYYDEKFGAWFFGRESDGGKIITNLRAARLTLLHAESGVGKTSLLRAGVAWRLHRLADDTFARGRPVRSIPVVFSSWKDDPATELAAAVAAAVRPYLADGRVPARASGPLDEVIAAAADAAGAGLLIMLDQFEEYFLYREREPVPERFADELARCVNRTDLRANFLIAIREDAYAGLGDLFKGRIANVYGNYLHIDFLDRASAEKAIREPLEVYNRQPGEGEPVSVQDELVETVLDEVRAFGSEPDAPIPVAAANGHRDQIATPLLQLVMQRVWDTERAEGSRQLRLSTLHQLHGVRTIVDGHLGQALGALSTAERQTAIDMFDHLVTPSGGKIAESVFDLAKRTGHAEDQVDGVLRKLDDERIVRPVPAAPGQDPVRFRRYEIFHDVLAPTINRAIAASEEQRRVRRFRRLAALSVALLVIVAAVAVVFAYLLNSANTEKLTAESRQLAAEADQQLSHDPQLSAALALQALHVRTTSAAEDALRAALPALQTIRTFDDGSTVIAATFDPADPDKVVSADYSGIAPMRDVRTGQTLARLSSGDFKKTGTANAVAFNTAGTQVAIGYTSGTVSLFDPRNGKKLESALIDPAGVYDMASVAATDEYVMVTGHQVVLWHSGPGAKCCQVLSNDLAYTVAVDPRDAHKFVIAEQGGAFIVDTSRPGRPREVRLGTVMPHDAEFSPDGSEVVTADSDGTVSVLRLASGKVIATFTSSDTNADVASFSPDGKRVVAGYLTGTARVWDVTSKLQLTLLTGHGAGISTAEFSPDGREVVTSSQDGTVRIWRAESQELRTEFTVPPNSPAAVPLNWVDYIGNRIIAHDPYGNNYLLTPSGTMEQDLNTATFAVAFSANRAATKIVSVDSGGQVKFWHATGSGTFRPSTVKVAPASDVVMSPDGARFAVVAHDGLTVQLLNADTGRLLRTLKANNEIQDVAFNPGSDQIVGVDTSGQLEVWNGAASQARSLGAPGPVLLGILFDQSGSRFVTGSTTGDVTVWSGRDDRVLRPINACPTPSGAELSPDGSKVVVACSDGTARVFSAGTGRALTVLQASTEQGRVSGASFSPDGSSIVTSVDASANGYIEVWNAELANASLAALERMAEQRVTLQLTPAQVQQYLNGTGG